MKIFAVASALFTIALAGCSDDPTFDEDSVSSDGFVIVYEDIGNSNLLLGCNASARQISSDTETFDVDRQVELGMSAAQIREIVGKPRHIVEGRWTFGHDVPIQHPLALNSQWDWLPTVTVPLIGTTAFSGDNTLCNGSEEQFVNDANSLNDETAPVDHSFEVPDCKTAARRIAARIELGMTAKQVRSLVGKPVEIAETGTWRYLYGAVGEYDPPAVQLGEASLVGSTDPFSDPFFGDNESTGTDNAIVIGYWSPEQFCQG